MRSKPAFRALFPLIFAVLVLSGLNARAESPTTSPGALQAFEKALGRLAEEQHLPGLSAAIVQNHAVIWSHGFGEADLARRIPAAPDTPYRLASLSKPFAAVLIMQLVQEGKLDLEAPMRNFAIHSWFEPGGGSWAHYPSRYTEKPITVRHVLTHTSESEPPGEAYNYNGNIFADLTWVIEDVTKKPYPEVLRERILEPVHMTRSLPGQLVPWGQKVAAAIATAYKLEDGKPVPGTYPGFGLDPEVDVSRWNLDPAYRLPAATQAARKTLLGRAYTPLYSSQTAAGMVSTVEDLARFDIALDTDQLVSAASREQMFTPVHNSAGKVLPYGLGWFVENVGGQRLVWHFGWFPPTVSAFYLKVPEKNLTLLLLSNCDGLSAGMAWTQKGVRASPYARLFLEEFVSR
jgi:CubicO group peptidase (beta-lactamase class C family)